MHGVKTNIKTQLLGYLHLLNKEAFGNILGVIITAIIFTYKKPKQSNHIPLFVPIILYFCVIIVKAPYIEARYFMPIYSMINIYTLCKIKEIFERSRPEKQTLFMIIALYSIILCNPIITKTKLDLTYEDYKPLVQKVQKENKPIVYVFDYTNNRFLDDLYLFTLVDKSIIVDKEHLTNEMLNNGDILLICRDNYIQEFSDKFQYSYNLVKDLNAYNVYEISHKTSMKIHSKTRVSAKTLVFIVELFPTNELTAIIMTSQLLHKYITTFF